MPVNVHRAAWWHDGAAPGDKAGAVLIAGHIDSAKQGVGAFFKLQRARPGDTAQVVTRQRPHADLPRWSPCGAWPKETLPTDIYSVRWAAAAGELVTCGGRFDQATGALPRADIVRGRDPGGRDRRVEEGRSNLTRPASRQRPLLCSDVHLEATLARIGAMAPR